jgi:hypothetical protein
MSRSLNKIRSLISEIDQIQKQGQKSTRSFAFSDSQLGQSESSVAPAPSVTPKAPNPDPAPVPVSQPSAPAMVAEVKPIPTVPRENRVKVQWSGSVVIELQLADSPETVELRQAGDLIEIHFADGKAFHIPFKAVA